MSPISEANLLCVLISDAPEVQNRVRALMNRIESQEARIDALSAGNEYLAARVVTLEAVNGAGDAASLSRTSANAYINRH
jgi:hypothetical protein